MDISGDIILSPTQGLGRGHLWGHYSVPDTGIRTWTSLGDIILSPTQGLGRGHLWGHYSVPHTHLLGDSQAGTTE